MSLLTTHLHCHESEPKGASNPELSHYSLTHYPTLPGWLRARASTTLPRIEFRRQDQWPRIELHGEDETAVLHEGCMDLCQYSRSLPSLAS